MNEDLKRSFAILQHEFRLQIYTAGFIIILAMLTLFSIRAVEPAESGLAQLFIAFYTAVIGLVLPWHMNTTGNIEPGYCRYHLSLPVKTWQLYVLPLLFRLFLIFVLVGVEVLLHRVLYGGGGQRYINNANMLYYTKVSILVYLVLQAYGWSKDSFKNLYFYLGIILGVCAFIKPVIIRNAVELPYFPVLILFFAGLAVVGVRNLRFGIICGLPGLQSLFNLLRSHKNFKERAFKCGASTQFHYEWKRTWFFMPAITLLAVILYTLLLHKLVNRNSTAVFAGFFISYASWILIMPLLGIIFIQQKGFNSTYLNHLPVKAKVLAEIKIKCFALSFAISQGLFFIWLSYILWGNFKVINLLYSENAEFMQSPGMILWSVAAMIIFSFFLAFFMAAAYLKNKAVSILFPILVLLYYFYGSLRYNFFSLKNPWILPGFVPLETMILAVIVIKFGLLYLDRKNFKIKMLYSIAALAVSFVYVLLCHKLVVLAILPVMLVFCYPVMALKQNLIRERHEVNDCRIEIPWKLVKTVFLVLAVFSIFVYVLDQRQKKELDVLIAQLEAADNAVIPGRQPISVEQFVKDNIKGAQIKEFEKYLKEKSVNRSFPDARNAGHYAYYDVNGYISDKIEEMIDKKQYAEAYRYYVLKLKTIEKFNTYRHYYVNTYQLTQILAHYTPSSKELALITRIQKNILNKNYAFIKNELISLTRQFQKENFSIYNFLYGTEPRQYNFLWMNLKDITGTYMSPFFLCCKINVSRTVLAVVEGIDFFAGGGNETAISLKLYPGVLGGHFYFFNSCSPLQKSMVLTAIMDYRAKYGKLPDKLTRLVPEYLEARDLYLLCDYADIRRYYSNGYYKSTPLIFRNTMWNMKLYLKARMKK